MKITNLKYTPVFVPIEAPLRYSQGAHPGFSRIIVELETDEGLVGLGECYSGKAREGQLEEFRPSLIGEDPFQIERIRWKLGSPGALKLFGHILPFAAIEFACLDLQGKALGRPVYELLGGKVRNHIPLSAYLFYRYPNEKNEGEVANAEQMVDLARSLVQQYGFQTIKYKNGVMSPDEEIATFKALRKAFPNHKIRMDPNAVWSVSTAVRVAKKLKDDDLEYLEDPTWGLRGMARVNRKAPWVTLASNMSVFAFEDLPVAALLDVLDVVLLDKRRDRQILKCKHRHIRSQRHPGSLAIHAGHSPQAPRWIFQILQIIILQFLGYPNRSADRPDRIGVHPDLMVWKCLAERLEGCDLLIRGHHAILVFNGLKSILLDQASRQVNHLLSVGNFTLILLVGITIKEVSGERNVITHLAAQQLIDRPSQRLSLQVETSEFDGCKRQDMSKKLERPRRSQLPADALDLKGIFTDQRRSELLKLPLSGLAAVAFSQADESLIRFELNDDARESGVRTLRIP